MPVRLDKIQQSIFALGGDYRLSPSHNVPLFLELDIFAQREERAS